MAQTDADTNSSYGTYEDIVAFMMMAVGGIYFLLVGVTLAILIFLDRLSDEMQNYFSYCVRQLHYGEEGN